MQTKSMQEEEVFKEIRDLPETIQEKISKIFIPFLFLVMHKRDIKIS